MTKNLYLNTGIASLIAFILLVIMYFSWPLKAYSLYDVILGNVNLSDLEKGDIIQSIGINYALDTIFIFSWIASWSGLYLHFKSLNVKGIGLCLGLSIAGALLDLSENSISFSLLTGNIKNPENVLLLHSFIRDISFWLPMVASFMLVMMIPKQSGLSYIALKFLGIIGVFFAILGMYIQSFSSIPYYWFGLWFLSSSLFLINNYRKTTITNKPPKTN
jgi:hypothetical protein